MTDGLLIHPVVGETKADDIPADVRMECYRCSIDNYYNKDTHAADGHAPGDALRGAAGSGAARTDPQELRREPFHRRPGPRRRRQLLRHLRCPKIFDEFKPDEIGITPLKFEHTFYCKKTQAMASPKTTNSPPKTA